jgi:hypothetical protein
VNHNPNSEKLRQILFAQIKELTIKGGIELYNGLMNDIEKCIIYDEEALKKVLLKK